MVHERCCVGTLTACGPPLQGGTSQTVASRAQWRSPLSHTDGTYSGATWSLFHPPPSFPPSLLPPSLYRDLLHHTELEALVAATSPSLPHLTPLSSMNSSSSMFLLTFHHPTWSHLVAGGRPELQPLDPRKEVQRVFPTPPADGPGTPARHNSTELLQMILLVYSAEFQPIRGPHLTLHRK